MPVARVRAELAKRERARTEASRGESGIWRPYPDGPQSRALASPANITGYGGAAGGGKSDLLLGAAATKHQHSIIFRKEYPQLGELFKRADELFGEHGRFNGQQKLWRLDDGRRIEFGACQRHQDWTKYKGRAHDLLAIDEAADFLASTFWSLLGWLRTTVAGQRCRAILTFNPPTSAEGRWIVDLFAPWLDRKHSAPAMPGELRWFARIDDELVERPDGEPFEHQGRPVQPLSRTFFPARLADNPALAATGYGATLDLLPEPLRSQLLYGDFDAGIADDQWQVIPTGWVEAAQARWSPDGGLNRPMTIMGVDIAHGGKDATVLAPRHGSWFALLHKHPGKDTPDGASAARLVMQAWSNNADINVDAIGWGASAAETLRNPTPHGYGVTQANAINVAERSEHHDKSGKFRMVNVRAEMYWRLREALDPQSSDPIALPPDRELLADLTAAKYEVTPSGIRIEAKEDISKRLGRSPDAGDAVALAMLIKPPPAVISRGKNPLLGYRGR